VNGFSKKLEDPLNDKEFNPFTVVTVGAPVAVSVRLFALLSLHAVTGDLPVIVVVSAPSSHS
jgi:hypothetical protein